MTKKSSKQKQKAIKIVKWTIGICWGLVLLSCLWSISKLAPDDSSPGLVLFGGIILSVIFGIFFLPTWIAIYKDNKQMGAIFIFNIFCISWPIALIMALGFKLPTTGGK